MLQIKFDKQILIFTWNNSLYFEMPLNTNAKKYYPFIGIKYKGG